MDKLTFLDIENILMCKQWSDLSTEERQLLQQYIGNKKQVMAYQQLLQQTKHVLDVQQQPELQVRPATQSLLHQKLKARQQTTQKNGLGSLLLGFWSLLTLRNPASSGIALAMLILTFWYGGQLEDNMQLQMDYASDSIAMHIQDTASTTKALPDSNQFIMNQKYIGNIVADSFAIQGILRK